MVNEVTKAQPTVDELILQMGEAYNAGDFETVKKLSTEVAKAQRAAEKDAEEAERIALSGLEQDIQKSIKKLLDKVIFPELAKGVWYVWDFEKAETEISCKLRRRTGSTPGTGGRVGKTGSRTSELLTKFGDEVITKDIHTSAATKSQSVKGMTYKKAH